MKVTKVKRGHLGIGLTLVMLWTSIVSAQTFNSGSTGANGAFSPATNTTLTMPPDGIFHYTTINIPAGVTVTFLKNAANTPVTMLATSDVTIAGTININGQNGLPSSASGPAVNSGGAGGPGGFSGGQGGARGTTNNPGSAGQGPGGGAAGAGGTFGPTSAFVGLIPLFGGSGGGGGAGSTDFSGQSGAGGGGAIVVASSTRIIVTGTISASGGRATPCAGGANGSGGAIRLVAPEVSGNGILQANGFTSCSSNGDGRPGGIRLEAFTLGFTGTLDPVPSTSVAPGPITASSNPALINLPTLTISSVGGVSPPSTPAASYTTADIALPAGTTNPVSITLNVTNTPIDTIFKVKLIPQFAAHTVVSAAALTGNFASSTTTASVTFPAGQVSIINAYAEFTLPSQMAGLYPLIDGEPAERVLLAAAYGEGSTVTLISKSGKQMRVDAALKEIR